ncbi:hypothetical protein H2201_004619 [Coniosporium apollinis]|uniref:Phosphoinositide phospholipase C n=2 Tax=Coniosporium TaxID=2810619 RepID=A0ABQ9NSE9_9PEZI|nr:hypothetical protein H2199_006715 [Cladosporium sp. JES 115]KAJ9665327.1 hypothetical protein H2201_004619 [Coniosporium apollinis]
MRRRSDSRSMTDGALDVSDLELELEDQEEEAIDDLGEPVSQRAIANGLGITTGRPSVGSAAEGAVGPIWSPFLEQGTTLTKVTKKKRKQLKFRLDFDSAKVWWDPSKPSKQFYIDDVWDIRSGADARPYYEEFRVSPAEQARWFTISYTKPDRSKGVIYKTMHLIARTDYTFQLWTTALDTMSRGRADMMQDLGRTAERSVRALWTSVMDRKFNRLERGDEDERLDFEGVKKICRNLHIFCAEKIIREQFNRADDDLLNSLNFTQFLRFLRRIKKRQDVKNVYESIKKPDEPGLSLEGFLAFLRDIQGVNAQSDMSYWVSVFERCCKSSKSKNKVENANGETASLRMSSAAFQAYLASPANHVLASLPSSVRHDRPLNEYFISSSHNTYLMGRQVAGQSSTEAYILALQAGCRCIEIDCWDGNDGRPIVVHGRTLTSSVQFSDCIAVIAEHAFKASSYPLIISLEVHCNPEQQAVMAAIMKSHFGDQLLLYPLASGSSILPSPEELKNKILIKVKASEERDDFASRSDLALARRGRSLSSPSTHPLVLDNSSIPGSPLLTLSPSSSPPERSGSFWATPRTPRTPPITPGRVSSNSSAEDSDTAAQNAEKTKRKKTSNIIRVLGDLGVYARGIKYSSFTAPEANTYNHIFSFNERTFDAKAKDPATKELLERHNMRYLMRVYPAGWRINSSNFEPHRYWRRGVQMAALNWQTYDIGQEMNRAMFAAGIDRTGYVLKPEELRPSARNIDFPTFGHRKPGKKLVKFSVDIISAQQLPRPRGLGEGASVNPYIEVEMYSADDKARGNAVGEGGLDASARNGMSGIGSPMRRRTAIVQGNGYDPLFNEAISISVDTRYPSLVFLRWTVWNSIDGQNYVNNGTPLATFTAKLSSLQQGYRHLPLYNLNGDPYIFSTLFCKIRKEEHVALDDARSFVSSPTEPSSPVQEPRSGRGEFLRRVFSRTPSDRKKRDAREDGDQNFFGRSGTV